jgi:hypothetical protein
VRRLGTVLCALLGLVAAATAAAGWVADPPEITGAEAVTAARAAFARADLPAQVDDRPVADTYRPRSRDAVDVWRIRADLRAGVVELFLARAGAAPVAVDDRNPHRSEYVLSDAQYETLVSSVQDPSADRTTSLRVGLVVGAALVVAVATALALAADPRERG